MTVQQKFPFEESGDQHATQDASKHWRSSAWARGPVAIARACFELVYPPTCTLCGGALLEATQVAMCGPCRDAVRGDCRHWCRRCGMPMERARFDEPTCLRCVKQKLPYDEVVILGRYQGAMREAVIAGKKYVHEPLMMALGGLLGEQIAGRLDSVPEIVTYVPSHWRRKLGRGTVPAGTLAKQVGRVLQRPVWRATRCVRGTTKQGKLSADQRATNMLNAFAIRSRYRCEGHSFLLVDDVMTTGATMGEVARVLLSAGASRVCVAAVARGAGKT